MPLGRALRLEDNNERALSHNEQERLPATRAGTMLTFDLTTTLLPHVIPPHLLNILQIKPFQPDHVTNSRSSNGNSRPTLP